MESSGLPLLLTRARNFAGPTAAGAEHLWLGVLDTPYGATLLEGLGLSFEQVLLEVRSTGQPGDWTDEARQVLEAAERAPLEGPVGERHLAYALVRPLERFMDAVGVVPSRLRWTVYGSDSRFPHPREGGDHGKMSWAAAASEEARRLGWDVVGPEQLLLGLLADPTNSATRALRLAGLDLRELRWEFERRGPGARVDEMQFSPQVLEVLKRAVETWGDLDPDSAYTLQALLAVTDVLGPAQAAVEAILPQVLHGNLTRGRRVSIGGVWVGMSASQVLEFRGEPDERELDTWTYGEVGVLLKNGSVIGVHGPTLEQQGEVVLQRGEDWLRAEVVLGVRRQVSFAGDPPVKIWTLVNEGAVGFLMLECLSHA